MQIFVLISLMATQILAMLGSVQWGKNDIFKVSSIQGRPTYSNTYIYFTTHTNNTWLSHNVFSKYLNRQSRVVFIAFSVQFSGRR